MGCIAALYVSAVASCIVVRIPITQGSLFGTQYQMLAAVRVLQLKAYRAVKGNTDARYQRCGRRHRTIILKSYGCSLNPPRLRQNTMVYYSSTAIPPHRWDKTA